ENRDITQRVQLFHEGIGHEAPSFRWGEGRGTPALVYRSAGWNSNQLLDTFSHAEVGGSVEGVQQPQRVGVGGPSKQFPLRPVQRQADRSTPEQATVECLRELAGEAVVNVGLGADEAAVAALEEEVWEGSGTHGVDAGAPTSIEKDERPVRHPCVVAP